MYQPQKSFHESNYQKVVFYMKLSVTIFLCLAAVLVSAYNIFGAFPFYIVITVLVLYLIASDALLFTGYQMVMKRNEKRKEIFNSVLFKPFHRHVVDHQLIYTKNKWEFTEETLVLNIGAFNVICNPSIENKNAIDFNFQAQIKLKRNNVENVISFYNENNIDIYSLNGITGVVKTIEIKKQTQFELYDDILKTAELLKNNGFESFNDWESVNGSAIFITGE